MFIAVRRICLYGTLSLTRGRVCHLQLLMALASAVILGSEFRGTRDHILLSQIRHFTTDYRSQCQSYITTDGQSASLSWNKASIWGLRSSLYYYYYYYYILSESCRFVCMGRSLWREDGFVVHFCCWASPAQSFSGPSSVGLVTTFYSLL
jgi:hypothetical protein